MTRRTKLEWEALIRAQAESGMTAAVFCRERGINARYFSLRRRQLSAASEKRASSFVPVSVGSFHHGEKITVRYQGSAAVELPVGVEPRWLAQLLQALRD